MDLIYWLVRSSGRRGWDGVNWVDGGYRYSGLLRVLLYYENLMQHPSINISILRDAIHMKANKIFILR